MFVRIPPTAVNHLGSPAFVQQMEACDCFHVTRAYGIGPSSFHSRSITSSLHQPLGSRAPSPQYALAAHAVSQLHAVDGGTTYGLPYDSLMPPVREKGKAALSCSGTINAVYWWTRTCDSGASRVLLPHGLFELCLRTVGVAADCWQRRNGLPVAAAAVAAAGGSVGDNSSSSSSSSSSSGNAASCEGQHGQGKAAPGAAEVETGRLARLCHPGGTGSAAGVSRISPAAAGPPRVTLEPSECPELAIQAMACSRVLMEGSCRAGAGARAGGRAGSEAGEAHAAVLEETGSGGCGDAAREACSSGSSSGSGSGSKDPGSWLRDGGPLARRWWRAAVAAVHCVMDELVGSKDEARSVYQVLDPSLAMPVSDPGGAQHIQAAHSHGCARPKPNAAVSAALQYCIAVCECVPGAVPALGRASLAQYSLLSHRRRRAVHRIATHHHVSKHELRCALCKNFFSVAGANASGLGANISPVLPPPSARRRCAAHRPAPWPLRRPGRRLPALPGAHTAHLLPVLQHAQRRNACLRRLVRG